MPYNELDGKGGRFESAWRSGKMNIERRGRDGWGWRVSEV